MKDYAKRSINSVAPADGRHFEAARVLVTGGAGFIGSHLAEVLAALGAGVVVLDDLSGGSVENLAGFDDRIEFVKGSITITNRATVERCTAGCRYVFHQAALTGLGTAERRAAESLHEVNVGCGGALRYEQQNQELSLGGGFGGVYAALRLDKTLARRADVEVTLVSCDNFLLFAPMLHEVASGDLNPSDIVNPIRRMLKTVCPSRRAIHRPGREASALHPRPAPAPAGPRL